MAQEKTITERLQQAFEAYQADNEKRGIKAPASADFDFYIQTDKYLTSISEKIYLAMIINSGLESPTEKDKAVKWAKKLLETHKDTPDKSTLFPDFSDTPLMFPLALKFISSVDPQMGQQYIDSNPITYIEAKIFMKPEETRVFRDPKREDLELAIRRMPKEKWKIEYLDAVEDTELSQRILRSLANDPSNAAPVIRRETEAKRAGKPFDNSALQIALQKIPEEYMRPFMIEHIDSEELKKSFSTTLAKHKFYCRDILEQELLKKEKGSGYSAEIAEAAFETRTGYKKNFPNPAVAGSLHLDISAFEKYAPRIYTPEGAKKILFNLAKADPGIGFQFVALEYPENKNAIDIYLAALPRAKELLSDPNNASVIIDVLNKLEPSQYAGQGHGLIPQKDIFKVLDGTSAGQLYDLITQQQSVTGYGFSQGTYNEISKRFYEQLKKENKTFSDLIRESPERGEKLRIFVQTADAFKRMDDLVTHLNREDHQRIAEMLFEKQEGYGHDISTLSSYITHLPKGSPALSYIESSIIDKALKGDDNDKADMGLLGRWYANQTVHKVSQDNQDFFNKVKSDPSFEVKDLGAIQSSKLLDGSGRNFQLHVFYNDKDGIDTFKSFSSSLKADGFQIKKQDDFLIFSKESNGRRIEILVSPPEKDGASIPQIVDYIKGKNGVMSVISGRGHAHHMEKAVGLITPDTKIVALGGCWGHNYASAVLEKSSDAHILATTGVGRMVINNFNTKWMNDQILAGRDLNWAHLEREWERIKKDKTLAKDIEQYVSPNQNVLLLYERRRAELYDEIEKRKKGETLSPTSQLNDTFMQSVRGAPAVTPPPQIISKVEPENAPALSV
jgi:hypothetical protein